MTIFLGHQRRIESNEIVRGLAEQRQCFVEAISCALILPLPLVIQREPEIEEMPEFARKRLIRHMRFMTLRPKPDNHMREGGPNERPQWVDSGRSAFTVRFPLRMSAMGGWPSAWTPRRTGPHLSRNPFLSRRRLLLQRI